MSVSSERGALAKVAQAPVPGSRVEKTDSKEKQLENAPQKRELAQVQVTSAPTAKRAAGVAGGLASVGGRVAEARRDSAPDSARVKKGDVLGAVSANVASAVAAAPAPSSPRPVAAKAPVAEPSPLQLFDSARRQRAAQRMPASTKALATDEARSETRADRSAGAGAASPLGAAGCYQLDATPRELSAPRRFVLDTAAYSVQNIANARLVTIPDSSVRARGYWYVTGTRLRVIWDDDRYPSFEISPSTNESAIAVIGGTRYALRRCDAR